MPSSERDALVERGLIESAGLGHDMIQRVADSLAAFYVCRRCLLGFTVGYLDVAGSSSAERSMELISAPALTTPCSGVGRVAT